MPRYELHHICPLSDEQQDKLAEAITQIHSEKFKSVSLGASSHNDTIPL